MSSWDDAYRTPEPWDIDRPQPAFVELVRSCEFNSGSVLDAGCGTGENALFLAENGFNVTGVDVVRRAIEIARSKAKARHVRLDFQVGNALQLKFRKNAFDNLIDSGLFHTFSDEDRLLYVNEVVRVLRNGGRYFMLCFSEKEPTDWGGPRRVSVAEIEEVLHGRLKINYVRETLFATRIHREGGRAHLTSATKG